jgi:hypothetical protein
VLDACLCVRAFRLLSDFGVCKHSQNRNQVARAVGTVTDVPLSLCVCVACRRMRLCVTLRAFLLCEGGSEGVCLSRRICVCVCVCVSYWSILQSCWTPLWRIRLSTKGRQLSKYDAACHLPSLNP